MFGEFQAKLQEIGLEIGQLPEMLAGPAGIALAGERPTPDTPDEDVMAAYIWLTPSADIAAATNSALLNALPEDRRIDHDLGGVQVIEIAPDDSEPMNPEDFSTVGNEEPRMFIVPGEDGMRLLIVDHDADSDAALAKLNAWLHDGTDALGSVKSRPDTAGATPLILGEFYPDLIPPLVPESEQAEFLQYWDAFGMTNAGAAQLTMTMDGNILNQHIHWACQRRAPA